MGGRPPGRKDSPGIVRAPTRATRKGNGPGWGGPAKGAGSSEAAQPPFAPGVAGAGASLPGAAGGGKKPTPATIDRDAEAEKSFAKLVEIRDGAETMQLQGWAAEKIIYIVEGTPKQRTELSGKDGGALMVVTGVPRADDP